MALRLSKTYFWGVVAALIVGAAILVVAALTVVTPQPSQSEGLPAPTHTPVQSESTPEIEAHPEIPESEPTPDEPEQPNIPESDILQMQVPALSLNIAVSGETHPRESASCQGGVVLCIDPPMIDQAAWYGATPATPGNGTVRLFGHTSYIDSLSGAFDAIPAVKDGDEIIVTTETGVFTYRADAPQLVPYTEVPQSQLIWADTADRLVLVTCNHPSGSGAVVEAWLTDVAERL